MLSDHIVKYRLVHFYVDATDPLTGEARRYERMASHGQRLSSDDGSNDGQTFYGVPKDELRRLELEGVFFTDAEIAAAEAGVTDATTVESTDSLRGPLGDTATSNMNVRDPDADPTTAFGGGPGFHPLTFAEMQTWQIEEYFRSAEPTPEELMEAVHNEPTPEARALLLGKFIDAENAVTGGEPRDELIQLAAAEGGFATTGPGPDEGGIEGTAPKSDENDGDGGQGGGAGGGSESEPKATEAAARLAAENGVDLADVPHDGDHVTYPDVQDYLKKKEAQ